VCTCDRLGSGHCVLRCYWVYPVTQIITLELLLSELSAAAFSIRACERSLHHRLHCFSAYLLYSPLNPPKYTNPGIILGRSPASSPMIWASPPVVGAPLHPNRALVPSCILNAWCYYRLTLHLKTLLHGIGLLYKAAA